MQDWSFSCQVRLKNETPTKPSETKNGHNFAETLQKQIERIEFKRAYFGQVDEFQKLWVFLFNIFALKEVQVFLKQHLHSFIIISQQFRAMISETSNAA